MPNFVFSFSSVLRHAMSDACIFGMLSMMPYASYMANTMLIAAQAFGLGLLIFGSVALLLVLATRDALLGSDGAPCRSLMCIPWFRCLYIVICLPDYAMQICRMLGLFLVKLFNKRASACVKLALIMCALPYVGAACTVCHGSASMFGCSGDSRTCPFATDVVSNAAAIVGGVATAALTVARIVPLWVSRLLSRDKLSVIVALAQRSNAGATPFNPAGKSVYDIQKAVRTGQWAKDDAIDHAQSMASKVVLPAGTDPSYTQKKDERDEWKQLARDLQKTSVLVESRREDETNSSAMLYLLAIKVRMIHE